MKVILSFTSGAKSLIVNKTNARSIAKALGPETNNWRGKSIVLVPSQVDFRGDIVDAIRVRPAAPAPLDGDYEADRRPYPNYSARPGQDAPKGAPPPSDAPDFNEDFTL